MPLKRPLQHYSPIPHTLLIRISRFQRGDHSDSTAPKTERLLKYLDSPVVFNYYLIEGESVEIRQRVFDQSDL